MFALWFFAFFFAQKISRTRWVQLLVFVIPVSMTVMAIKGIPMRPADAMVTKTNSVWKPWTEEKMKAETGKFVFVDFTAEWCLTCKVNKKLVLETSDFEDLAKKYDVVLMRADWTKRDDNITQFLNANNAAGVPAYFIQKKDGTVVALGETVSISKVEKVLTTSP